MNSVKDLLDILMSQETLYIEMREILEAEKGCVVTWDAEKTIELVKKKDTLSYKEKVLDEAFRSILKKLQKELDIDSLRVQDIPAEAAGEYHEDIQNARTRLLKLISEISTLNTSLKILYKTNITLIQGVFGKLGLAGRNTYGMNRAYGNAKTSTISKTG